jgi:hypothetical protein
VVFQRNKREMGIEVNGKRVQVCVKKLAGQRLMDLA